MKITKFWAKGFRSLSDVTLVGLGDFNVFYGPNGSGKSNILGALRTLFELAGSIGATGLKQQKVALGLHGPFGAVAGEQAQASGALRAKDFRVGDPEKTMVLGVEVQAVDGNRPVDVELSMGRAILQSALIEVVADLKVPSIPRLSLSRVTFDGKQWGDALVAQLNGDPYADFCAFLMNLESRAYALVDADRFPHLEQTVTAHDTRSAVATHLREGHLKNALFVAQNSPNAGMRSRFKVLRTLLQEPPLERRPFDVVQDPSTQELDIREPLPGGDVSIDLVGLGVAQTYSILANIVLRDAQAVGVEEPEAHLHAPTSGRHLRQVLQRVVERHLKQQIFITTHSNLFDLDPNGYWDVSMVDGATRVERRPLKDLDAHFYEPGPAKHALAQLLRHAPPDEVVFRRPDGAPVTAGEMLSLLAQDADVAVEFLRTLHGAALRVVRLDSQRAGSDK